MVNPIKAVKKITAIERGFNKTKSGRKEMKANDIFINRISKASRKSGTPIGDTAKSVAVRPKGSKVPVKRKSK